MNALKYYCKLFCKIHSTNNKPRPGRGAEVPHGVDCLVLGEVLGDVVPGPGQDVHHAARQVARLEYLQHQRG